jgi:hypothetical protein
VLALALELLGGTQAQGDELQLVDFAGEAFDEAII